ncbi:MAG: sigma-70 family RNA polymerase sigma factor [Solirubrobacteraceae bacterium]|nr:sigma-70 family RNA polymerase sigma factor [Solirubrobacteraceae bacterium]
MPLLPSDISRLYEAHARGLVAYFARRTYDAEHAVDLTAETFATAFRQRARFIGEPDRDGPRWIYGIARNHLQTFYRDGRVERSAMAKLGVERRALTEPEYERIEELAELATVRQRVASELAAMPDEQARILQMRVVDEQGYDEIASALQISEQTARARVSRALRSLAVRIEPFMPSEEASRA